jgi:hypothetical protein
MRKFPISTPCKKIKNFLTVVSVGLLILFQPHCVFSQKSDDAKKSGVAIPFTLKSAGFVTLVIENSDGKRVKNLISDTRFNAGKNVVYWDGTDDLGRDLVAAKKGMYNIPVSLVPAGTYKVKGIVHTEIKSTYEFSVYAPGNPPWSTKDHEGGWLANHTPPQSALFVPADQSPTNGPAVYLGSYVTEGIDGLAWVDLAGKKLGGKTWVGGNWIAAPFLARDAAKGADTAIYAYVAACFETAKESKQGEIRITGINRKKDKQILKYNIGTLSTGEIQDELNGFAINEGLTVLSLPQKRKLVIVSLKTGKVLDSTSIKQGAGLAFDNTGKLLAISGNSVLRYKQFSGSGKFILERTLIDKGLDEPVALTCDADNNIYVSNHGSSHQVKVFTEDGKLLSAIGEAGVPKTGTYNPLHMNNPAGLTIDSKQQLWVTEDDYLPKRVSIWSLKGKLIKAIYGPAKYGGGGTLDNMNKNKFYYADASKGVMEFEIDWATGKSTLKTVLYRKDAEKVPLASRNAAPETPIYFNGKRYFTNAYNSIATGGSTGVFIFTDRNGYLQPCAGIGRGDKWPVLDQPEFASLWSKILVGKTKKSNVLFLWNDLNDDLKVQVNEVMLQKGTATGMSVMADLSFAVANMEDKAIRFSPERFTSLGTPVYAINTGKTIVVGVQDAASSGGNQLLIDAGGWSVITLGVKPFDRYSISGAKNGIAMWSYPNVWPGLHAAKSAPLPDFSGELIGPTRLLGGLMQNKGSNSGALWAINSNHGMVYIFTADGLFVTTLFQPMRTGKRWDTVLKRGEDLKDMTLGEENFWPTITETEAGETYMVDGAHSSVIKIDGLKSIERLPDMSITLKNGNIAAKQNSISPEFDNSYEVQIKVVQPVVDGLITDWKSVPEMKIDNKTSGSIIISKDRLYAVYKTGDKNLLRNSLEMPLAPFKTGGALDIMIGSSTSKDVNRKLPVAGDLRLLVTMNKNKPYALVYKAVTTSKVKDEGVPFSSPDRTITFDQVSDVSKEIKFAGKDGMYEFSIPLLVLGLNPANGLKINGDIGVLKGDGTHTSSRIYWTNKSTSIVSDVPSEAELTPSLWGQFSFKLK